MTPAELVERWDRQQAAYIAERESRFTAMLDTLEFATGGEFTALDLACGPGSLTARILDRFPQSRIVAVDYDPMLLALARDYLAGYADRVRFVDADLTDPHWTDLVAAQLDTAPHAVVSTTALHWLRPEQLIGLYTQIRSVLAPDGIFLNGDHFRFDDRDGHITLWSAQHDRRTQQHSFAAGADEWDQWWDLLRAHPRIGTLQDERTARFAERDGTAPTGVQFQLAALRHAGFAESGTVWQLFDDYVVYGIA
ncbi:class I SAM-dependent methyltransferase [Rhodococcus sp. NPDC003382]